MVEEEEEEEEEQALGRHGPGECSIFPVQKGSVFTFASFLPPAPSPPTFPSLALPCRCLGYRRV